MAERSMAELAAAAAAACGNSPRPSHYRLSGCSGLSVFNWRPVGGEGVVDSSDDSLLWYNNATDWKLCFADEEPNADNI